MLLLLGFLRQRRSRSLGLYKSHMQRQLLSRHQPGKVILRKKAGAEEEEAEAKEFLLTFFCFSKDKMLVGLFFEIISSRGDFLL